MQAGRFRIVLESRSRWDAHRCPMGGLYDRGDSHLFRDTGNHKLILNVNNEWMDGWMDGLEPWAEEVRRQLGIYAVKMTGWLAIPRSRETVGGE